MRRRKFITLVGGAAAMSSSVWPRAVRAQQRTTQVMGFAFAQPILHANPPWAC
jgi:hypothetical protein